MKNILVTGGAGFIGANFVRHLLNNLPSAKVTNLDLLTYAGSLENLAGLEDEPRHTFVQGDICDNSLVENLLRVNQTDTIVHFAAESHVDRSIFDSSPFIKTNIQGTVSLMDAARKVWSWAGWAKDAAPRFHHVSTDEVYGSLLPDDPPFTEATPYQPNSPYAASKAASDHFVRAYAHTHGLPVTISNCTNNYGPYQFPEKLIPLVILNAVEGKPLPVYGDGKQIRDWLYVTDHCEAILRILEDGEPGETYSIGGENQPSNLELVKKLCAILDELLPDSPHCPHASLIQFVPDRPGHDRRYAMDIRKIKDQLGWEPKTTLDKGLERTVKWYLGNPAWVEALSNRSSYAEWIAKNYGGRGSG